MAAPAPDPCYVAVAQDRYNWLAGLTPSEFALALETPGYISDVEYDCWIAQDQDDVPVLRRDLPTEGLIAQALQAHFECGTAYDCKAAVDASLQERIDAIIQRTPAGGAFTPMQKTTEVSAAKIDAPRYKIEFLISILRIIGIPVGSPVLAINTNFGGVAQPGFEHHIKKKAKERPLAPAGRRNRPLEGEGGSFNSALEAKLMPAADSALAAQLVERDGSVRSYHLKYFPTTGSMQVTGVVLADASDGTWAADAWIEFLNTTKILGDPPASRPNPMYADMVNFKFRLRRLTERQVLDHQAVFDYVNGLPPGILPAPLIKSTQRAPIDGNRASFRFLHREKTPRVNMFLRSGKVNFLGFPSVDFARKVYDVLVRAVSDDWDRFVKLRPLKDDGADEQLVELVDVLERPATRAVEHAELVLTADECRTLDVVLCSDVPAVHGISDTGVEKH